MKLLLRECGTNITADKNQWHKIDNQEINLHIKGK